MAVPDPSCLHDRVLRLEIPGHEDHWICAVCNIQFIPKKVVDYKIANLAGSVLRLQEENERLKGRRDEQATRVWREENVQE